MFVIYLFVFARLSFLSGDTKTIKVRLRTLMMIKY